MAQSTNQRVGLSGLDEVRRGLANVAADATQSGNTIRQVLLQATGAANNFSGGLQQTEVSARATRYAIQNLSFQVNDVVTSLASGISPFRTLTQQGGQFVQLFEQGGGVSAVLGGLVSRLTALVTPTRAVVAGIAGVAGGVAALAIRAENSEVAAQKFDVQLRAIGKTSGISGKELEEAAHRLNDVGLGLGEARTKLRDFIAAGGDPKLAETITRGAENLSADLGKATGESFAQAVASGGLETLQGIAKRLNIPINDAIKSAFVDFTEENRKFNFQLEDAVIKRNRAILENERRTRQQIRDLTRERGTERSFPGQENITDRREILVQSARQEEEIRRQSQFQILDMQREFARQRNEESRKALAEYNKTVQEAADKEGEIRRLAFAISHKVDGDYMASLGPVGRAIHNLNVEWNSVLDTLEKSGAITGTIKALEFLAEGLNNMIKTASAVMDFWKALGGFFVRNVVDPIVGGFQTIIYWTEYTIGLIGKLLDKAATGIIKNVDVTQPATISPSGATGGLIRGPGTGTSDSINAWVSNGEYLVNAAATRMNLPLLEAINSMNRPAISRRGFAAGGLVSGMEAPTVFSLVIEGKSFGGLSAPARVARDMMEFARTSVLASAGPAPSWKS